MFNIMSGTDLLDLLTSINYQSLGTLKMARNIRASFIIHDQVFPCADEVAHVRDGRAAARVGGGARLAAVRRARHAHTRARRSGVL